MKRDLYILTQDSRFFYSAVQVLKNHCIRFKALNFGTNAYRPANWSLILTTKEEKPLIKQTRTQKVFAFDPDIDPEIFLLRVLSEQLGIASNHLLTVGIDPGRTNTGVAYLVDKKTIFTYTTHDISLIPTYVHTFSAAFPNHKHLVLKIGNGVPRLTKTFLNILRVQPNLPAQLFVELVDEKNTSLKKYKRWSPSRAVKTRDEMAAIKIAHRDGIKVEFLAH